MPLQSGNLLIVDDEPSILKILTLILSKSVTHIQTASNGKEALEILNSGTIYAVLSDINMPVMNGLELLFHVRDRGMDIPFVFLTAYADKEKSVEALRLGATDFLEKPFEPETVIEVIRKVLELAAAMKEVELETEGLYTANNIPIDQRHRLQKMKQAVLMMRRTAKIYTKIP